MIGKKIPAKNKASTKSARITDLTNYIREPEAVGKGEKCIFHGSRNFIFDDPEAQTAEMVALAQESRSPDPIEHHVFSWREGEQPSKQQVDEMITIILKEYGLENHQCVYGLHNDTDNIHLHICINRVNPDTNKVVDINGRFVHEAIHKAVARIEKAQGWSREQKGRYVVTDNDEAVREYKAKEAKPKQKKIDKEIETGEKSAERICIEKTQPIVKRITKPETESERISTWEQFHSELAKAGLRYEPHGGGAVFIHGEIQVKASVVNREASLSKLEKRFGTYAPPDTPIQPEKPTPEPIESLPADQREHWNAYITARHQFKAAKDNAKAILSKRHERELATLLKEHKEYRDEFLWGNYKGQGKQLNALRADIAKRQEAEKKELKTKHKSERDQLQSEYGSFPRYEDWLTAKGHHRTAQEYRHRETLTPAQILGYQDERPVKAREIFGYEAERVNDEIHYSRLGGAGGVSFVDKGNLIDIHDWRNPETTLAALKLSHQKWPNGFQVIGNDEYKAMCVKLAVIHGFRITNRELQEAIKTERTRIEARQQQVKSKQLSEFERYAEAVNADRYRVTVIKFNTNGGKQTFVLDKADGVTKGFTPAEIASHTGEMLALQKRGENIYYTPLSEKQHHVLIDDLRRENLDRLIADGFKPAVVIESSQGNCQAVITIPKLGTPHDHDVGNRLAERLNKEYGDKNLSEAIHPHRAPGYENRKPSHQRKDKSFPEVKLLKAEQRTCPKTLALSQEINSQYEMQEIKQETIKPVVEPVYSESVSSGTLDYAYNQHYRSINRILKGNLTDPSRIDSMIALRLRATGHSLREIEATILKNAQRLPQRKETERHNWSDYAARTARYAFSPAADNELVKYAKYRTQWKNMEQPPKPKPTPALKPAPTLGGQESTASQPPPASKSQPDAPKKEETPIQLKPAPTVDLQQRRPELIEYFVKTYEDLIAKSRGTDNMKEYAMAHVFKEFEEKLGIKFSEKDLEEIAKKAGNTDDAVSTAHGTSRSPARLKELEIVINRERTINIKL